MRVIVFALRGCPAGWLGAYGNEWVGTPNLDRLAAEGVVFDQHISDCPDGEAARAAWLTGRHQIPAIEGAAPPRPVGPRLNELLRAAGVRTVLVRANHPDTDALPPFYAGWDEVFDARPRADDVSPLDHLLAEWPGLLDRLSGVPAFLLWVETDRLIPPWDVAQEVFEAYIDAPEEDDAEAAGAGDGDGEAEEEVELAAEVGAGSDESTPPAEPVTPFADPPTGPFDKADLAAWEWLHRTFAAVVTTLDAELGRAFEQFRARGLDQSAAWLVSSDFGYPLGEHGQVGVHRPWLHEELVHLPLLVRLPGGAEAGRRVSALTQPADLAPTLLELLGVGTPPGGMDGRSLLPLARGQATSIREFACTGLDLGDAPEWSIRTTDRALLLPVRPHPADPPREPMLFDKPDDRWELNDIRPRNVEQADELEAVLRAFLAGLSPPG